MSNTRILPLFGGGGGGEQGIQGIQGIQGPAGSGGGGTGIQGLQGLQGTAGSNGTDGLQGYIGLQGETGAQGYQGYQGENGANGIDGLQGYIGLQGTAGADGLNGQNGLQGIQGFIGLQGPAGRDGSGGGADITYINNFTQEQLVDFYNNYMLGDIIDYLPLYVDTFPVVDIFDQAEEYNNEEVEVVCLGYEPYIEPSEDSANVGLLFYKVYPDGTTDDNAILEGVLVTVNGLQNALQDISGGIQGVQGAMGLQGETGAQGATGANGADGLQGYIGIQGAAGSNGIDGLQGYIGLQGETGAQGYQGYQGENGANGIDGLQGYIGIQGAAGSNGIDGLQGYTGFQGIQGADGGSGMERVDLLEMDTQELIDLHDDIIDSTATIDDLWYGQYKVVGVEAVEQQEGNRNTRAPLLWVYLYLSPWVSGGNDPKVMSQQYVMLKPDGSLVLSGVGYDLGVIKYDLSTLSQQELADLYDACVNNGDWSTFEDNLVTFEGKPVTGWYEQPEQVDDGNGNMEEVTVLYATLDTNVSYDYDSDGYPILIEDSEKQFISTDILKIYEDGSTQLENVGNDFVTVLGLQNALQDISGGQGIQGIQGTMGLQGYIGIQGINGADGLQGYIGIQGTTGIQGSDGNVSSNTVELQFILEDDTSVNYEVYIRQ